MYFKLTFTAYSKAGVSCLRTSVIEMISKVNIKKNIKCRNNINPEQFPVSDGI